MQKMPKNVHFVGIGGVSMSGIARVLAESGYIVSGSDLRYTEVIEKLRLMGVKCFIGHNPKHIEGTEMLIVSTAISKDNPEVLEAKKRDIPIIHRGEALAALMDDFKGIAVTGSHGKTTTTSMLALIMEMSGYDPTVVIGSELEQIGGNAKKGNGEYLIAESDESDASFLYFNPYMAIITNIEDDHMDYYKTMDNLLKSFEQFISRIDPKGIVVLCCDDPNIQQIMQRIRVPVVTYGRNGDADYQIKNMYLNGGINSADVYKKDEYIGKLKLSVPGVHNLLNALAALVLSMNIGIDFETAATALSGFKGARRRYQLLGEINGIKIIDDYAHHPTEIQATLQAARQENKKRVIAVFQPHRYTRTKYLYERFGSALSEADVVIISDIYSAGEEVIEGVSSKLIVDEVQKHNNCKVFHIKNLSDIARYLIGILKRGDIVLTMGAGDVYKCGIELVDMLKGNMFLKLENSFNLGVRC